MRILVTGSNGFVGKNLCRTLKNIEQGRDVRFPDLHIGKIMEIDASSPYSELETACKNADFVFHLAGVNRSENENDFTEVNVGFTKRVTELLEKHGNRCPVMLSSSILAETETIYGKTKKQAEDILLDYSERTGVKVLIYRFANLFGKWSRPDYNSVVATFCYRLSRGLPMTVTESDREITLCHIDDVVNELVFALSGKEYREGLYCEVRKRYRITVGELAQMLKRISETDFLKEITECGDDSLYAKLFSTYLSYLPPDKAKSFYPARSDTRGSFAELFKTEKSGQISVNIIKPGMTKGKHWHSLKWEVFVVLSGEGIVRQRQKGDTEVFEYRVSGLSPEGVCVLPGYVHSIENLSLTENLVLLIYASENFDISRPDTFSEEV